MYNSRTINPRIGLGFIAVLSMIVLAGVLLFPWAGQFLVAEDQFAYADTVLILSGDPISRALAARDLYLQGRIKQILIIPEPPDKAREELVGLGLMDPNLPPISERILIASGVPREKISFLLEPVDGIIEEARCVRRFLEGQPPQSLAVITSEFASRYACFVFHRILWNIEIFCSPTPYGPLKPGQTLAFELQG